MRVADNLRALGFGGPIRFVNPRYPEIGGEPCFPSLSALPEAPDAVFVGTAAEHAVAVVEEAGRCGVRAAIVNASGFADSGADGETLQRRLVEAAKLSDMAVCGPNNMGYINVHDRVCMYTARVLPRLDPGPTAIISQSGSVAIAISQDARGLGISHVITAGNEAVCTAADYLQAVVEDDHVRIVVMFLETIRNPRGFASAAAEAARRGKPIIVVKVGRSEGARAAVAAHTGALSGEDKVYDAFFHRYGIVRANDIDEMIETAMLLSKYPAAPEPRRPIVVTVSGGEAALITDLAVDIGLSFPALAPQTVEAMKSAFPAFSRPRNPVDSWGLGWDPARFRQIFRSLISEPAAGVVALSVDAPGDGGADAKVARDMAQIAIDASASHDKKVLFFNNAAAGGVNAEVRAILDPYGIPYLLGMRPALAAIAHWLKRQPVQAPAGHARIDLPALRDLSETERMELVAENAGIPFVACAIVNDPEKAVCAAQRLGFPVVMKGLSSQLHHKTELDLVKLGVADARGVVSAFQGLVASLGRHAGDDRKAQIVVQPMVEEGVQLLLGARSDPEFGSVVVVGLGGTLVETMNQTSLRLGPVTTETAREMLAETPAAALIRGMRGKGPFDLEAAVEAIAGFSVFAHATTDAIAAIEINPLIVHAKGKGVMALDLVLEPLRACAHEMPSAAIPPRRFVTEGTQNDGRIDSLRDP